MTKYPPRERGENNPAWKGDSVGYWGMHQRLLTIQGKASNWPCSNSNCSKRAKVWALMPDSTQIKEDFINQRLISYSTDINDYIPLCSSCHFRLDKSGSVTHCKHGHEWTTENTYTSPRNGNKKCKTCRNISHANQRKQRQQQAIIQRENIQIEYHIDCDSSCWYALNVECVCSCGGENHGVGHSHLAT